MNSNFSLEQLEERLELRWYRVRFLGVCHKKIWFVKIPYPCFKYYRIWLPF